MRYHDKISIKYKASEPEETKTRMSNVFYTVADSPVKHWIFIQ